MKHSLAKIFSKRQDTATVVIAEIGVNHNGDMDQAIRMIDQAKAAGADVVKFQTFKTELLISRHQPKMPYQVKTAKETNQFDMLKKLELNLLQHKKLIAYCRKTQIDFLSTPYDPESAALLVQLGLKALKVASTDTTNLPFLRYLRSLGLPLILSTGVSAMDEVECVMREFDKNYPLALLHCVSNYPCPLGELNLRCIRTYQEKFGRPTGFSDHSASLDVGAFAVCAGARILEKHFTLDKNASGPDHAASLTFAELKDYIGQVRKVESLLGDGQKRITKSESQIKPHMQKSLVAKRPLKRGKILREADLWTMRPATGISPLAVDMVMGKRLKKKKGRFEQILLRDLEDA